MPNDTRAIIPGGTFFFMVALLERRRALLTEHVDGLGQAFRHCGHGDPARSMPSWCGRIICIACGPCRQMMWTIRRVGA